MKHYLDYNATAPVRPQVQAVMQELLALPLNASSAHAMGRKAKSIIEDSRRVVAEAIGAFTNEVVFTASGTEANNWALGALAHHRLFISTIEHSSVLKTVQGRDHTAIPVTADGIVDLEAFDSLLLSSCAKAQYDGFIVSVMLANNETGAIQPIADIAKIVHEKGGLLHCDAVQGMGKIPVDFTALGCDLMTISAHKMGGPVGAAALIVRNNMPIKPMLVGGGQELNRRAGTENVAAIAGFAKAVELIDLSQMKPLKDWHAELESDLQTNIPIAGSKAPRLSNVTCIAMPAVPAETQLISFDLAGIAVSAGSACSSGRIEASHVLKAMGIEDSMAGSFIRISSGWNSKKEDFTALKNAWQKLYNLKNPQNLRQA